MGAWSYKALDSDNGLDVIDFIKEYVSSKYPTLESRELNLWDLIVAIKEDGLLGESFEDVDFLFDNSAIALAELYFMLSLIHIFFITQLIQHVYVMYFSIGYQYDCRYGSLYIIQEMCIRDRTNGEELH